MATACKIYNYDLSAEEKLLIDFNILNKFDNLFDDEFEYQSPFENKAQFNLVEPIKSLKDLAKVKKYLKNFNLMYYTIFMIGINTGLRISDILGLDIEDVYQKEYISIKEKRLVNLRK